MTYVEKRRERSEVRADYRSWLNMQLTQQVSTDENGISNLLLNTLNLKSEEDTR